MSQLDRGERSRIVYVESKVDGTARVGRATFSRSGLSVYFGGRRFERIKGGGVSGNYRDADTGDEYWISGVKRDGRDRHWAERGPIQVDEDVAEEYAAFLRG